MIQHFCGIVSSRPSEEKAGPRGRRSVPPAGMPRGCRWEGPVAREGPAVVPVPHQPCRLRAGRSVDAATTSLTPVAGQVWERPHTESRPGDHTAAQDQRALPPVPASPRPTGWSWEAVTDSDALPSLPRRVSDALMRGRQSGGGLRPPPPPGPGHCPGRRAPLGQMPCGSVPDGPNGQAALASSGARRARPGGASPTTAELSSMGLLSCVMVVGPDQGIACPLQVVGGPV